MFLMLVRVIVFTVLIALLSNPLLGQVLHRELNVRVPLRAFDSQIRDQLIVWFDSRDAALSRDGKQTAEWFRIERRLNPINIHGDTLLHYAKANAGSKEALICLAYIVEWTEGDPPHLYRSACEELLLHHRDDPALSSMMSSCTRPWSFDENKSFLTHVLRQSQNPAVRAAARYHLAQLFDNSLTIHGQIARTRERFEAAGVLEASPDLNGRLVKLEQMDSVELASERDQLLAGLLGNDGDWKPWSAKRTFGRLDYEFTANPDALSFRQQAEELIYQVTHLREGCIAPEFAGRLSDGRPFQLSARRGSPTLLMFSFKGCGACEAMYPALRTVQEKFAKDGFSVIGVMVDEELQTVTSAIESETITWPCVWDGPSGPVAKLYKVSGYPDALLLNGEGRIVARDLRHEELIEHVTELLHDSMKPAQPAKP